MQLICHWTNNIDIRTFQGENQALSNTNTSSPFPRETSSTHAKKLHRNMGGALFARLFKRLKTIQNVWARHLVLKWCVSLLQSLFRNNLKHIICADGNRNNKRFCSRVFAQRHYYLVHKSLFYPPVNTLQISTLLYRKFRVYNLVFILMPWRRLGLVIISS